MSADLYDPILGVILQATGNNNNSWGDTFNNSAAKPFGRAIGGIATHTETSGTVDLSTVVPPAGLRLDVDMIQKFTGALVGNVTLQVTNVSKTWLIWNATTNAFSLLVKTSAGTAIEVPQGCMRLLACDGGNVIIRSDSDAVGSIRMSGKSAAGPGGLACDGASYLRADHPDLFGKIGTTYGAADGLHFNVPNFITNNLFFRTAGGSLAVGATQTNQNAAHTHTITGAPGVGTLSTDAQGAHTPSGSVTLNSLVFNAANVGSAGGGGNSFTTGGFSATGVVNLNAPTSSLTFAGNVVGAHIHNVTGAPSAGTLGTASSGGSEARPNAAVVMVEILY